MLQELVFSMAISSQLTIVVTLILLSLFGAAAVIDCLRDLNGSSLPSGVLSRYF